jgi:hypothetical protein
LEEVQGAVMKKRYLAVAGLPAVCTCLILVVLAVLPHSAAITKSNFDRIKEGMTLAEVEAILGTDRGFGGIPAGIKLPTRGHKNEVWGGEEGYAIITLNERKCVVEKDWNDAPIPFLERIRRWLP